MMNELRRKDRAISENEATALLKQAEYGVLSTSSADAVPYGVPLNYCLIDNCIYFHCAVEGHKIDNIEQNKSVSFCVVGDTKVLPSKLSTAYESAIVSGEAEEVFDNEKKIALEGLLLKYSPEFYDKGTDCIEDAEDITRVFKITIDRITGKSRKA